MSLVHDMAESVVGDLTPHCGVSDGDKHQREVAAMEKFRSLVGQKAGPEMYNLFMVCRVTCILACYSDGMGLMSSALGKLFLLSFSVLEPCWGDTDSFPQAITSVLLLCASRGPAQG